MLYMTCLELRCFALLEWKTENTFLLASMERKSVQGPQTESHIHTKPREFWKWMEKNCWMQSNEGRKESWNGLLSSFIFISFFFTPVPLARNTIGFLLLWFPPLVHKVWLKSCLAGAGWESWCHRKRKTALTELLLIAFFTELIFWYGKCVTLLPSTFFKRHASVVLSAIYCFISSAFPP